MSQRWLSMSLLALLVAIPSAAAQPTKEDRAKEEALLKEKFRKEWERTWNEQKEMFWWPRRMTAYRSAELGKLSFGDEISDEGTRTQFAAPESYAAEVDLLVKESGSLNFQKGWDRTFRDAAFRGIRRVTSEDVWLAMEQLWLQAEVLAAIRSVNSKAGQFQQAPFKNADGTLREDNPKHRLFRSPIWELELRIVKGKDKDFFTGKSTNISPRLQVMGLGGKLEFNVRLGTVNKPLTCVVEGPSVEVGQSLLIASRRKNAIAADGFDRLEIVSVDQAFDLQTAPVKRIESLMLGALDDGSREKKLEMAEFSKRAMVDQETKSANGFERLRYLRATEQYRLIPFSVAVMADQEWLPEIQKALANSKIRCQITQCEWRRFRGMIRTETEPTPKSDVPLGPLSPGTEVKSSNVAEVSIHGVALLANRFDPARLRISGPFPIHDGFDRWTRINETIRSGLPAPGPEGNMKGDAEPLWSSREGLVATSKNFERLSKGVDPRVAFLQDEMRQHLPMLDIEAVHVRYAPSLEGFFKNAGEYGKNWVGQEFSGMENAQRDPLLAKEPIYPEGGGWIFEIRGSTYFDSGGVDARELIKRTLSRHLQLKGSDNRLAAVEGRISHAFLYNTWRDDSPRPAVFHFIHSSLIDELLDGPALRPPTVALGGYRRASLPPKLPVPEKKADGPMRQEFVLVFVWNEPAANQEARNPVLEMPKPLSPWFDPVPQMDRRRINPSVLDITEIQADLVRAKILAYDIRTGSEGRAEIGVLTKQINEKDPAQRPLIDYIPFEPAKLEGKRPAYTIYPQRMILLQASFPYRAQVEEVQRALRLQSVENVLATPDTAPLFRGVVIERQMTRADGIAGKREPLDVDDGYRKTIFPRKFGDLEEAAALKRVVLSEDHELVMPLPKLVSGEYPPCRLASIENAIRAMDAIKAPPRDKPIPLGRDGIIPEAVLVRILDTDIAPGNKYRYRIKVRMRNPNWVGRKKDFAKYDLVARRDDANVEIIEGRFVELPVAVDVPRDEFIFAIDPPEPRVLAKDLKPGEALMQIQRWLPYAQIGTLREPVADWIVADVIVKIGTYVSGSQFVGLPLYSPESNRYVMPELPPEKGARSKEPRRGVLMDLNHSRPYYMVVDVQGGVVDSRPGTRRITETVANEVLLMDESGKLQVRSSAVDRADRERLSRQEQWRKWIESVAPLTQPKKDFGDFK